MGAQPSGAMTISAGHVKRTPTVVPQSEAGDGCGSCFWTVATAWEALPHRLGVCLFDLAERVPAGSVMAAPG